jgi:hypothetical protein
VPIDAALQKLIGAVAQSLGVDLGADRAFQEARDRICNLFDLHAPSEWVEWGGATLMPDAVRRDEEKKTQMDAVNRLVALQKPAPMPRPKPRKRVSNSSHSSRRAR